MRKTLAAEMQTRLPASWTHAARREVYLCSIMKIHLLISLFSSVYLYMRMLLHTKMKSFAFPFVPTHMFCPNVAETHGSEAYVEDWAVRSQKPHMLQLLVPQQLVALSGTCICSVFFHFRFCAVYMKYNDVILGTKQFAAIFCFVCVQIMICIFYNTFCAWVMTQAKTPKKPTTKTISLFIIIIMSSYDFVH